MRIRTAIAVATLLPASLAFAVTPAETGDGTCRADEDGRTVTVEDTEVPVEYCETTIFAQCDNAVDGDGAGKLILPNEAVTLAPAAPDTSFTAGGGCGTVDEPVFASQSIEDAMYQFAATGFGQAGSMDSLTLETHWLGLTGGYAGQDLHFDVRITVDGVSLFGTVTDPDATGQGNNTSPAFQRVTVPAVVSSTGASVSTTFTVTDIDDLLPPVQPGTFRSVAVSFGPPHTGECGTLPTNNTPRCVPSGYSAWVMGATEVPSGVTFNPAEAAATTITAIVES